MKWCAECQKSVEKISSIHKKIESLYNGKCPCCGSPQKGNSHCRKCVEYASQLDQIRAWGVFGDSLREVIHQLKYKRDMSLGEFASRPMIGLLQDLDWHPDLVAPVPLAKKRRQERGFNQSFLLAFPIGLASHTPVSSNTVVRIKETIAQVGLSARERKENVKNAFVAKREKVFGKKILLIDDVFTTGSTVNACAKALKEAGAKTVYALTLARAADPING